VPAERAGKTLAAKIGLKGRRHLALVHAPPGWPAAAAPEGVRVSRARSEGADVTVAFFRAAEALHAEAPGLAATVPPGGSLWVAWPRRAAGHTSDITDNEVRAALLPTGLVDVKVAALDDDWSGLQFVWRRHLRPPTG
jgi:hypothetical protein